MEYRSFDEIDAPIGTVTEAHPSHRLDYRRFASDEVVRYNRMQIEILRPLSPGRLMVHNFMQMFLEFDHYPVAADLDVATWDSYPLGALEVMWFDQDTKARWLRTGHPDFASFNHDLYRGMSAQPFWVMEQQPGPVNWARFNPAPLPGMVALWTLEACAHGAEFTSYFRWRQAPFAQEQMHAGLLRPDSSEADAADEARAAATVLQGIGPQVAVIAPVALVFSYEAAWVIGIQPQGRSFRYLELVFEAYSALRAKGLDVDIVSPDADLSAYRMVIVPTLPIVPEGFAEKLAALDCPVLLGPRSGSKTASFCIPEGLAPGPFRDLTGVTVTRVESLRDGIAEPADGFAVTRWREDVASDLAPELSDSAGRGVVYAHENIRYCAIWPDRALLARLVEWMAGEAGVELLDLPEGIRVRRSASHTFTFNYAAAPVHVPHLGETLAPASWHIAPR
jgi:beta-galactosidase